MIFFSSQDSFGRLLDYRLYILIIGAAVIDPLASHNRCLLAVPMYVWACLFQLFSDQLFRESSCGENLAL
jgi:hypothetical protein